MKTILYILQKAGGWHPDLYLKIDNPPYMELVIEAMDESGPMGLPAISVVHYGGPYIIGANASVYSHLDHFSDFNGLQSTSRLDIVPLGVRPGFRISCFLREKHGCVD